MITDILTYISSYEEIRAVTGLNSQELPDATLALAVYRFRLETQLSAVTGVYPDGEGEENLQDIFDRLDPTDQMHQTIQLLAIYSTADVVMETGALRAYKTISDGKSNITRFSSESTYRDTRQAIKDALTAVFSVLRLLFGDSLTEITYVEAVAPSIDLISGE